MTTQSPVRPNSDDTCPDLTDEHYIGRFAPSPTGLLHMGSLAGALASYLDAKFNNGLWYLRIDDLDPPREIPGAAKAILESLTKHGLNWDGEELWQSNRHGVYQAVISQLISANKAFYCNCSRLQIQGENGIHLGKCTPAITDSTLSESKVGLAVRALAGEKRIEFTDRIQGGYFQNIRRDVGDFVLQRKDALFAYQLASVIDDAFQGITHVVRGSDLLSSTPRQIFLQRIIGLPTPKYAHIPVIVNPQQQKLSKQTFAKAISNENVIENLLKALAYLRQPMPPSEFTNKTADLLQWSAENWDLTSIPNQLTIAELSS
ncbi:MAG: glutamyl-Q tRNA(Asp) synthetase [Oceanicoccus sp.]|jgi:glutamyl-Q tRNA(Asp) synthetase